MESKKYKWLEPLSRAISCESASEVRGPVAMIMIWFSSMRVTSSRVMVISLSLAMASVTLAAKVVRSTASACPAGTAHSRAIFSNCDPARRISSFSSQGAVFSLSDFSEFEQTSSAKSAV